MSDDSFRLLVEGVKEYAIFILDPNGVIVSWNEGAKCIKGYTAQEAIGQHFSIFYPSEDKISGKPDHALEIALHEGKYMEEGWRIRKDRSQFWANVVITPLYDKNKKLQGFSKVTRDLTARKKVEEELRQSLKQNIEVARSNQDLNDYAYIAAHDLKEPLRGISNYAYLLTQEYGEKIGPEGKEMLETLKSLSQRMGTLLDSLLQVARLGSTELSLEETDLSEVLQEVFEFLHASLDENKIELRVPRPLPTIFCDRVRIKEVFHNLIINAIKYNDKPLKWIEIGWMETLQKDEKEKSLIFYVRDNGIGIPKGYHTKIFQNFQRLHGRDQFGGGTGMGLNIVKKIIERHKGRIWVESTSGEGSTFYFTLGINKKI